jgi:hypothetical protein
MAVQSLGSSAMTAILRTMAIGFVLATRTERRAAT